MSAEAGTRRRFRTEAANDLYHRSVFGKNGTGTTGWLNGLAASFDAIEAEAAAGTLDEAWAAAEAALQAARDAGFGGGFPLSVTANAPLANDYTAAASMTEASGPTPAAALRSLAEALRAVPA